jgi:hypothetical protein
MKTGTTILIHEKITTLRKRYLICLETFIEVFMKHNLRERTTTTSYFENMQKKTLKNYKICDTMELSFMNEQRIEILYSL